MLARMIWANMPSTEAGGEENPAPGTEANEKWPFADAISGWR